MKAISKKTNNKQRIFSLFKRYLIWSLILTPFALIFGTYGYYHHLCDTNYFTAADYYKKYDQYKYLVNLCENNYYKEILISPLSSYIGIPLSLFITFGYALFLKSGLKRFFFKHVGFMAFWFFYVDFLSRIFNLSTPHPRLMEATTYSVGYMPYYLFDPSYAKVYGSDYTFLDALSTALVELAIAFVFFSILLLIVALFGHSIGLLTRKVAQRVQSKR